MNMYNIVNLIYCIFKENATVENKMNPQLFKKQSSEIHYFKILPYHT
jgi:hypothetical protein